MERREFIKAVGLALSEKPTEKPTTLTLKKGAEASTKAVVGFDGKRPQGNSLDFSDRSVAAAKQRLLEDARRHLPVGTKFYVLDGGERYIWKEGKSTKVDLVGWFYYPGPVIQPDSLRAKVIAEVTA